MSETPSNSQESFVKKGAKKVALSAAKLAAAAALLVSPEATAADTPEQQKIPEVEVTYEDKIEAAVDYQNTYFEADYPLQLNTESASFQFVSKKELSEAVQEKLDQLGYSMEGEREYYELTARTQEPDEMATARKVFEEGRVSERDYLSMTDVSSFEGWAYNENGTIIGPIEVLHMLQEKESNPITGETDISLILGLPKDDERVDAYTIYADVENPLVAEAYCEQDGVVAAGVGISHTQPDRDIMLKPFVIDREDEKLVLRNP